MTKLTDALRAEQVNDDHDLLTRFTEPYVDDVYLRFSPANGWWMLGSLSRVLTLDSHGGALPASRHEWRTAIAWAVPQTGVQDWVRSPFGGNHFVPKTVLDRARRALHAAAAERARQELHEAQQRHGCAGRGHSFRPYGDPKTGARFSACVVCGVRRPVSDR